MPRAGEEGAQGFDQWFADLQRGSVDRGGRRGEAEGVGGGDLVVERGVGSGEGEEEGKGIGSFLETVGNGGELGITTQQEGGAGMETKEEGQDVGEEKKAEEEEDDDDSDASWESDEEGETCGICSNIRAVVRCEQCACSMCGECSNQVHETVISKHTVKPPNQECRHLGDQVPSILDQVCSVLNSEPSVVVLARASQHGQMMTTKKSDCGTSSPTLRDPKPQSQHPKL